MISDFMIDDFCYRIERHCVDESNQELNYVLADNDRDQSPTRRGSPPNPIAGKAANPRVMKTSVSTPWLTAVEPQFRIHRCRPAVPGLET